MNDNNLIYATMYKGIEVNKNVLINPKKQTDKNVRLVQIEVNLKIEYNQKKQMIKNDRLMQIEVNQNVLINPKGI